MRLSQPRGGGIRSLPRDCRSASGSGGYAGSRFFVRSYVDYGILVEVQWWPDGHRCMRLVQLLASNHFGRTWRVRPSSFASKQNHYLGHASRSVRLVSRHRGAYGDIAAEQAPQHVFASSRVTPDPHRGFSKASVAAGGLPHAHLVRC